MPLVPELPAFDSKSFSKRIYEKVRQGLGYVEIDGVKHPVKNDSPPYVVFDPASATGFPNLVTGLRGQQDVMQRHEEQLNGEDGLKKHLDRIDAREAAHHVAQDGRLDALEAAHRPFGSGSG